MDPRLLAFLERAKFRAVRFDDGRDCVTAKRKEARLLSIAAYGCGVSLIKPCKVEAMMILPRAAFCSEDASSANRTFCFAIG